MILGAIPHSGAGYKIIYHLFHIFDKFVSNSRRVNYLTEVLQRELSIDITVLKDINAEKNTNKSEISRNYDYSNTQFDINLNRSR